MHDHRELVAAIRAKDAAGAEQVTVKHLRHPEGRFAHIQEQMRRVRAEGTEAIPAWESIRAERPAVRGGVKEAR